VKLSLKKLKVKRHTSQITLARGLAELERDGLVSVTRKPGSSALVTINEIAEDLAL
jgi:DNA-binding HxlR family transcriptional regulator